jgi:hypothetical protein
VVDIKEIEPSPNFDYDLENNKRKQIIDAEPTAIVARPKQSNQKSQRILRKGSAS